MCICFRTLIRKGWNELKVDINYPLALSRVFLKQGLFLSLFEIDK